MGVPQQLDGFKWKIHENPMKMDENWGYPYFGKPPQRSQCVPNKKLAKVVLPGWAVLSSSNPVNEWPGKQLQLSMNLSQSYPS